MEEEVDVSVDHIMHQGLLRRVDHSLDSLVHCVRKKVESMNQLLSSAICKRAVDFGSFLD